MAKFVRCRYHRGAKDDCSLACAIFKLGFRFFANYDFADIRAFSPSLSTVRTHSYMESSRFDHVVRGEGERSEGAFYTRETASSETRTVESRCRGS